MGGLAAGGGGAGSVGFGGGGGGGGGAKQHAITGVVQHCSCDGLVGAVLSGFVGTVAEKGKIR